MVHQDDILRFRLIHLLYLVTLLGVSMATFGAFGFGLGVVAAFVWWIAWKKRDVPQCSAVVPPVKNRHPFRLVEAFVVFVVIGVLWAIVTPAMRSGPAPPRIDCMNNLKQIIAALQNYHDVYGSFPPAYIADEQGQPMHSWRVLILPFLECQPLYESYHFDEPWDGPNNRKLAAAMPDAYACPSHNDQRDACKTSYMAVVGPNAAWPGPRGRRLDEFFFYGAKTIHLVECPTHTVNWLEPRDLALEEALAVMAGDTLDEHCGHQADCVLFTSGMGFNAAFANSQVAHLPIGAPRELISPLLRCDNAETVDIHALWSASSSTWRLRWGIVYRLSVFCCVVIAPLPWVMRPRQKWPIVMTFPFPNLR